MSYVEDHHGSEPPSMMSTFTTVLAVFLLGKEAEFSGTLVPGVHLAPPPEPATQRDQMDTGEEEGEAAAVVAELERGRRAQEREEEDEDGWETDFCGNQGFRDWHGRGGSAGHKITQLVEAMEFHQVTKFTDTSWWK
ncbi:hypothetical protein B0H13DRAFT_1905643 [Mycena leptocephala]|nr:hypothetical protein B0H13DRAFT_1905643 [Mycena leptocephala]